MESQSSKIYQISIFVTDVVCKSLNVTRDVFCGVL